MAGWHGFDDDVGPWFGVRVNRRLAKSVGDDQLRPDAKEALRFNEDSPEIASRVVEALRLLREGVFCAPGLMHTS